MSPLHTHDPQVLPLLRALGIPDPEGCTRVTIDFKVGNVVKAFVERFPQTVDVKAIEDLGIEVEIVEVAS